MTDEKFIRFIRSFVRREGRVSKRQKQALDLYWSQFGIDYTGEPMTLESLFHNDHPIILEIGFGMGHSLLAQAQSHLDHNYLGLEVHRPGVGSLLADCKEHNIHNLRVMQYDAVEVVKHSIKEDALSGIQIYFPDPWPKNKHHKRRLIQGDFLSLLIQKLKVGGFIHLATDWKNYAEQMLAVLSAEKQLHNISEESSGYWQNDGRRPLTKFEKRGQRLGHDVWDLLFVRR